MKKIISFFAVVPIAAALLTACNAADISDYGGDTIIECQDSVPDRDVKVTLSEAYDIAGNFFYSDAGNGLLPTKSADSSTKTISKSATIKEDGQDLMYVFNYEGGGFVIVGSTRNYYPILAYSDEGSFELSDDMGPVDVWLDETKVCIKNSGSLDDSTKSQMRNLWARYDGTYVDPTQEVLAARRPQTRSTGEDYCWDRIEALHALYGSEGWTFTTVSDAEQVFEDAGLSSYYADICYSAAQNHSALNETVIGYKNPIHNIVEPRINTEWYQRGPFGKLCPYKVAGCGAVAAGQVMFYHKYPATMNWAGESFTWSSTDIPQNPVSSSKQPQLMRMLGQKFQMNYKPDSTSSTNVTKVVNGLDSLGYVVSQDTLNTWRVKNELLVSGRPVIMFGTISTNPHDDGHFWVCEGTHEIIYDAIQFYTENQPYGAGNFTQGMYSLNSPGIVGGSNFFHYFYMNWGWFYTTSNPNGWFVQNNYNSGQGNFQYLKKTIYVSKPQQI